MGVEDLLSQATCAVIIDNEICGTAWLVSADGELLTAGHVLGTENPLQKVDVQFTSDIRQKAHKIDWGYQKDKGIDFAILKLSNPIPRQPLPITLAQSVGGKCRLMGFGISLKDLSGGVGEFGMPTEPQNNPANRLFTLHSNSLCEEGYSGGAVFSDELQAIVAIQVEAMTQKLGAHRDTVLAMPLYRISHYWLKLNNLARQKANNSPPILQKPFLVSGVQNAMYLFAILAIVAMVCIFGLVILPIANNKPTLQQTVVPSLKQTNTVEPILNISTTTFSTNTPSEQLFFDDFSNNKNGWNFNIGDNGAVGLVQQSLVVSAKDEKCVVAPIPNFNVADEYYIESNIKVTKDIGVVLGYAFGSEPSKYNKYGIGWYNRLGSNWAILSFTPNDSVFDPSSDIASDSKLWEDNESFTLGMEVLNGGYALYLNGENLATTQFKPEGNRIGVFMCTTLIGLIRDDDTNEVRFDNLVIRKSR